MVRLQPFEAPLRQQASLCCKNALKAKLGILGGKSALNTPPNGHRSAPKAIHTSSQAEGACALFYMTIEQPTTVTLRD
jgi:hypothetical protein